mmetsp:Transcript_24510/g.66592  ORF Transcript_24510/g.66592 Transcript_24510/m.66592 type:complete len:463 (+) Transcript_24510:580-1968(+)
MVQSIQARRGHARGSGRDLFALDDFCDLLPTQGLVLLQARRQEVELLLVGFEKLSRAVGRLLEDVPHLLVDELARSRRKLRALVIGRVNGAHCVAHAIARDHVARNAGCRGEVPLGAGGHMRVSKDDFLGDAAAHGHVEGGEHLLAAHVELVLLGQVRDHAQRHAAGHDGGLVDGHGALGLESDECMPALVVGGHLEVVRGDVGRLALGAHADLVAGVLERVHAHGVAAVVGGLERGHVHEVVQVCAREAGRGARNPLHVHALLERDGLGVEGEDLLAPLDVGQGHVDHGVEAPRPHERAVQDLGEVGRADDDDAFVLVEAVQLDEELVESHLHRLLVLWVAVGADGVDLIDEDDARTARLRRGEEVAHAPGAHAHEDLLKLRPRHVEEGHTCLASDSARKQRLARARRAREHDALGQLAAEAREGLGRAQVAHDLLELRLDLVHAHHVLEGLGGRGHRLDV